MVLGARGVRETEDGQLPIEKQSRRNRLRRASLRILARSLAAAIALTLLTLLPSG